MEKIKSFLDDDYINEILSDFNEKELEKAVIDKILSVINKIPDELSKNVSKDIKKRKFELIKDNQKYRNSFERKLYEQWKEPLECHLYLLQTKDQ